LAGVEFRSRWGDLHVGIAGVTKKKPKDEEVNGRKERRPKILEPVGGPDRCLLIGSFRGTKQESTWSHRKPYKPKSNRATSSKTGRSHFEPLTSLPRKPRCSRRSREAHSGFTAAAASLSSSKHTAGQTASQTIFILSKRTAKSSKKKLLAI